MEQKRNKLEQRSGRATIRDVARFAGVAPSTVSRVFGGGYASESTRATVFQAAQILQYVGVPRTRTRKTKATRMVGVLVSEPTNPVYAAIIGGLEQELSTEGYDLLLSSIGWNSTREQRVIQGLAARRIDGLVVSLCDDRDVSTAIMLRSLRIPVVLLDRDPLTDEYDAVLVDHHRGIQHAVRYLADLGHRRIGLISGPMAVRPARERLQAYRQALEAHGIPFEPGLLRQGGYDAQFGRWAAADLLGLPTPPTALVAAGHLLGVGVLEVLRSKGVSVPRELSFIAYDDIEVFRLNNPAITVIHRDCVQMGRLAGQLLINRLWSGGKGGRKAFLSTQLLVRESCAPIA